MIGMLGQSEIPSFIGAGSLRELLKTRNMRLD
jgi:hypothetical protein